MTTDTTVTATATYTHEQYIQDIRQIVIDHVLATSDTLSPEDVTAIQGVLTSTKLVYGIGERRTRGRTVYKAWEKDAKVEHVCEVCASCEQSPLQLAGTAIHELAHVLAPGQGHNDTWKDATQVLGLLGAKAAGTDYTESTFAPDVLAKVQALPAMTDGKAIFLTRAGLDPTQLAALQARMNTCSAGIGTRGGKSRGIGSGSRLRKYRCDCGQIIRASTDTLQATHDVCGSTFKRV